MSIRITDSNGQKPSFTQWEVDRTLRIYGAPDCTARFENAQLLRALVVPTTAETGYRECKVPNFLLQFHIPFTVSLFVQGDEGRVVHRETFQIRPAKKPQDYTFEENIGYTNWVVRSAEAQALIDEIEAKLANGDLKGDKGDPFTYADFTEAQLAALVGPAGADGQAGVDGQDGVDGAPGPAGATGERGPQGPKGDPFTYADFTEEQLAALVGPQGETGPAGATGERGPQGVQGPAGAAGTAGNSIWRASTAPINYSGSPAYMKANLQGRSGVNPRAGDAIFRGGAYVWYITSVSGNVCYVAPGGSMKGDQGPAGPAGADGVGVPAGGTTGQVLKKASNTDYDTEWADESGGGGGASDYTDLSNKPQINGVTLSGNKSASDLGLAPSGAYVKPSGGIPKADLAFVVQNSLRRADSAYQKPSGGIPATDLASDVIPSLTGYATESWVQQQGYLTGSTETVQDIGVTGSGASEALYLSTAHEDYAVPTTDGLAACLATKLDLNQGVAHAGEFVVVGNDGNVTTVTMSVWQGGSY
jgi:hypothetical protein